MKPDSAVDQTQSSRDPESAVPEGVMSITFACAGAGPQLSVRVKRLLKQCGWRFGFKAVAAPPLTNEHRAAFYREQFPKVGGRADA